MSPTSRAAIPVNHETSTSCPCPEVMARRASERRVHVAALVGTVRCAHGLVFSGNRSGLGFGPTPQGRTWRLAP